MNDNWQKKKIAASKAFQTKAYDEVNELVFRERHGKNITLVDGTQLTEFVSCSYLGLDLDPRLIQAASKNLSQCGVTFPAARTRIKAESFMILEGLLNKIFCDGYSTTFSTLHLGHLGVLPLLGSGEMPSFPVKANGFQFILDKTVHSSIQIHRALLQQFGEVILIPFENEKIIRDSFEKAHAENKTPVAISDSIGSMGGIAPIPYLFDLAEHYDGYIYLDDAHGTSICGKNGSGYVLEALHHHFHPRLILASSLAKAFGTVAGVIVVPTKEDALMIQRFSPTYIFGGPPPLAVIDSAIASANIHLSDEIYVLQKQLRENIDYFDKLLWDHIINTHTPSPIRGMVIGNEFKAIECTKELRKRGFAVTTAMYPTVPRNNSMLRVALSAAHTKEQITLLSENIKDVIYNVRDLRVDLPAPSENESCWVRSLNKNNLSTDLCDRQDIYESSTLV